MTSSQHAPYALGYTRTTMVGTKGSKPARVSESHQTQPQFRLQAATRLHEGGIASNRRSAYCGEFVPGPLHTARHTMEAGHARSSYPNLSGGGTPKAGLVTGVKS